jgi:protoporphyrin/coproporphyrin ferrochelatase
MVNMPDYDAFLLLSFGGPEGPDDVLPFLENVTRGRGVPAERLAEVAGHYHALGGVSPINAQCRDMLGAIGAALRAGGIGLPMYWGNRNWHPFIEDTVRQMKADGVQRAIAFVTSAYSSYSACRQYLDDIDRAVARVQAEGGPRPPGAGRALRIDKIRPYFNHPGFIEPFAAGVADALAGLPPAAQAGARLVFTAHSVPLGMAAASGSPSAGTALAGAPGGRYAAELREASRLIAERASSFLLPRPEGTADRNRQEKRARSGSAYPAANIPAPHPANLPAPHQANLPAPHQASRPALPFDLVFQSRSGPPSVPWLEPDVNDHLAALAKGTLPDGTPLRDGVPTAVVVVPVGFVSDHVEVLHDLDVEAAQTAASLGLPFARAKAPGPTARFAAMVRELVAERVSGAPALALGDLGLGAFTGGADSCPADCCRYAPARPGPAVVST